MFSLIRSCACVLPLLLVTALVASPVAAQDPYDALGVSLVQVDRSSIYLDVNAGASGAPAGFVVLWMLRSDYDALGGWPADLYDPAVKRCDFTGTPTLTTAGTSPTYALAPEASIRVEVGDLFDETGIETDYTYELPAETEFVIRARANGDGGGFASPWSQDAFVTTLSEANDCVLTQGFWKTHPEAWPVDNLDLGDRNYTKEELLAILNTPAAGNGLIFLAHQLIAAKLNIANGASSGAIQPTIDDADALIGANVVPPVGGGFIAPADASGLTEDLDQYNNGNFGTPHCDTVPAETSTWGRVKGLYR